MISVEIIEELYAAVAALRRSLDMSMQMGVLSRDGKFSQRLKIVALKMESLRLDLQFVRRGRQEQPKEMLHNLRNDLAALLNDPDFVHVASRLRFRPIPPGRAPLPVELQNPELSVPAAVDMLVRRIDELTESEIAHVAVSGSATLRRVVPAQKLAPAMFDILDSKLVLINQQATPRSEDIANIQRARDILLQRGKSIIEALEQSNCDRRVLGSLRELQSGLSNRDNIIELGLVNLGVDRVCKSAAAELPEALLGAIDGHIVGIGMYVAQFDEWQRFSENATNVEIDANDIERIGDAAQAIIERLDQHPEIAASEVPKTLKALHALISNPQLASKRAAFAVLRTIENLVAKVYQHGADFLDKTATKTVDGLSSTASKMIIGALMAVALAATTSLGGVSGKVAEAAWMRTAAEIVKKQIEEVTR
jgi:hypothetical protein